LFRRLFVAVRSKFSREFQLFQTPWDEVQDAALRAHIMENGLQNWGVESMLDPSSPVCGARMRARYETVLLPAYEAVQWTPENDEFIREQVRCNGLDFCNLDVQREQNADEDAKTPFHMYLRYMIKCETPDSFLCVSTLSNMV